MTVEKIAILVDSASDVPRQYREKYNMYAAPLTIIYKDAEYLLRSWCTPVPG